MNNVTILISSFDGFSDCWQPYIHGLKKYWPDCSYDAFIITNYKDTGDKRVKAIKVGKDEGWSMRMLSAFKYIKSPYILYFHEDFWIQERVDSKVIDEYVAILENDKADYIRLYPSPPPDYDFPYDNRLGVIAENAAYRTSLQAALWRKSVLEELIKPNENPWQFELNSPVRSKKYGDRFLGVKRFYDKQGPNSPVRSKKYGDRFLGVKRFYDKQGHEYHYFGINYIASAIITGRWIKAAMEYAKREGLSIDFSNRPHENWWDRFKRENRFGTLCGAMEAIVCCPLEQVCGKTRKFLFTKKPYF